MIQIKVLVFNPFQVNTYILYDETGECAIIDPACYETFEEEMLHEFISSNKLKPVLHLYTHCHIDHVLGTNFIYEKYGIKPMTHIDSKVFIQNAKAHGTGFGFNIQELVMPEKWIEDEEVLSFGKQKLKAILTPGHANGSLCYYDEKNEFVVCGDVLFHGGIGRTDLPTGDYETLINSINTKLLTLPDNVVVFPGHGDKSTIGFEKSNNPFLTGM